MNNDAPTNGSLAGLRVVDLTAGYGAYAARLFADLGAEVIRVERAEIDRPPASQVDSYDTFVNAGKRSIKLDLEQADGRALLDRLLARSDVLFTSLDPTWATEHELDPARLVRTHPRLVVVTVTPLGWDQTDPSVADDDLTVMAAGGLLSLGGYPDAEPVIAYGRQSQVAASLFVAVGALVAVLDRDRIGRGRWIDISAQECVAQALEDAVATYDLTGHVRKRLGSAPREAGTGIYPCADGYVSMVAGRLGTARAWAALVAWMVEDGVPGATELTAPEWSTLSHRQRPESIETFGEVFGRFTATRTRQALYRDAQARQIALSPVNDIESVLADPQLAARNFFVDVDDPSIPARLRYPGRPYRLSATPASPTRPAPVPGADTGRILAELRDPVRSEDATLKAVIAE